MRKEWQEFCVTSICCIKYGWWMRVCVLFISKQKIKVIREKLVDKKRCSLMKKKWAMPSYRGEKNKIGKYYVRTRNVWCKIRIQIVVINLRLKPDKKYFLHSWKRMLGIWENRIWVAHCNWREIGFFLYQPEERKERKGKKRKDCDNEKSKDFSEK